MTNPEDFKKEVELYKRMQKSPLFFIEHMWKLVPQRIKASKQADFFIIQALSGEAWEEQKRRITKDWFDDFEKGKNISWQQYLILLSVEKAVRKEASAFISIASGHGIGKSAVVSWLILWFLFCHYDAQVPCTAPGADQMYDVLWKELNLWIGRLPEKIKAKFVWESDHIRMSESPKTWFARAKTSSKENTEALAGVHSDNVFVAVDEASGVPEQVYNTAEGSWTSGNILVILISNPTRINGYFYDTHHKLKMNWQTWQFSSIDSPVVDVEYEEKIAMRHGRDSAEYGIRVLGVFPKDDSMDDSGYVSLLIEKNINERPSFGDIEFGANSILGVDPAGEGDDKTSWVIRDQFKAKKLHEESISNPKTIAEKTITFIDKYKLNPKNVVVDNFGAGADVGKEIAIASSGKYNVTTINGGEMCDSESDQELYLNKRAEGYYKSKQWMQSGGEIIESPNFKQELLSIKYKRNLKGKIQIMPKVEMKKKYGTKSPNDADAFSLTFLRQIKKQSDDDIARVLREASEDFDPYAVW